MNYIFLSIPDRSTSIIKRKLKKQIEKKKNCKYIFLLVVSSWFPWHLASNVVSLPFPTSTDVDASSTLLSHPLQPVCPALFHVVFLLHTKHIFDLKKLAIRRKDEEEDEILMLYFYPIKRACFRRNNKQYNGASFTIEYTTSKTD